MNQTVNNNAGDSIIIECQHCHQPLRIPKVEKRVQTRCPKCGYMFSYPFTPARTANSRRVPLGWLALALLVIVAGYAAIRYFVDRSSYERGHQAYQRAECGTAIRLFDSVLHGWRIIKLDSQSTASAQQESAECVSFQAALEQEQAGKTDLALAGYADFINTQISSALVPYARARVSSLFEQSSATALASGLSCRKVSLLLKENAVPRPGTSLPPLYLACGQVWDAANEPRDSFEMYKILLTYFPTRPEAAEAEAAVLKNPAASEQAMALKASQAIAQRQDFLPSLYSVCGKAYEKQSEWTNAVSMYNNLLAEYPDHALAVEAETGLARVMVAQAKETSGGNIPAPALSGSAASGTTEVVIQNSSPEELRIVFSGPEAHVENLEACASCITYPLLEPTHCPEQGPTVHYTLQPGEYDVVVESLSEPNTRPWTGHWSLENGDRYESCFYIMKPYAP